MKFCGWCRKRRRRPYGMYVERHVPEPVLDDDLLLLSSQQFTFGELKMFTDDFNDNNLIGRTQFCNVYRGKIPKSYNGGVEQDEKVVTVKIWADLAYHPGYNENVRRLGFANIFQRFKGEVMFLSTKGPSMHPNLVKLMGWCCEIENETMGAVYDLNPYDTLRNLIPGEMLKWEDRIKITVALASLLEAFHKHQPRYLVLNISAAHIMLDQDWNPVLLEFGMLTSKPDCLTVVRFPYGAYGYEDPYFSVTGYSYSTDVFGFGVILMELLSKCTVDGSKDFKVERPFYIHLRILKLYESLKEAKWVVPSGTIVEKSLMDDAGFNLHDEIMLTMLAVECINWPAMMPRPSMKKVVRRLEYLYVAKSEKLMVIESIDPEL